MVGIKKLSRDNRNISFMIPIKTQMNIDVLNKLAQGTFPSFLKCSYQSNKTHHILTFDASETIPLNSENVSAGINDIFFGFIDAVNECQSQALSLKNIRLETTLMCLQEERLKLILLPINTPAAESYKKTLRRFAKAIRPMAQDNTVKDFIRKIREANDESQARKILDGIAIKTEYTPEYSSEQSESETTFLSSFEEETSAETETTFLDVTKEDAHVLGETVLLCDTEAEPKMDQNVFLIRNKTGLQIPIHKPSFLIGNVGGGVDYQVEDNANISRCHASLIFEENKCYIIDHKSTNRSFVEGIAIPPCEKIELDNGALFTLGNENFQVFMEAR